MSEIGFALTGSFCTFERAIEQMKILRAAGHNVTPIMSFHAYNLDTKFGKAADFNKKIERFELDFIKKILKILLIH